MMLYKRSNTAQLSYQEKLCNYINKDRFDLHKKSKKAKNMGTVLCINRQELECLTSFESLVSVLLDTMIKSRKIQLKITKLHQIINLVSFVMYSLR